jgi:general secretion pathway protein L
MAHRILGVDLGAYSVKVVVATSGLRAASVVDVLEAPLPPAGDEPADERAIRAFAALAERHGLVHDIPTFTVPGDAVSLRIIDFDFSGVKRADLERAMGGELEQLLPHELEELVYDFDVVPKERPEAAPGAILGTGEVTAIGAGAGSAADPTRPEGTRVLAVATTRTRVRRLLELGAAHNLEPRALVAAPTSLVRVVNRVPALAAEPLLVVDCGHARTDVLVVKRGRPIYARTVSRAGRQVTQAIAGAWNLPWEQAEAAKHSDGFIASAREPAQSAAWQRISEVVSAELAPLGRELRQTLMACKTSTGVLPRRVLVCGGSARMRGFAAWLGEQVDLPVVTVAEVQAELGGKDLAQKLEGGLTLDTALPAMGAALEAATGRPAFDLRKGEFAYRADFSFLRQRAGFLAAVALAVIGFGAVNAYAALYKLRQEEKILDARLKTASTEILGQALTAEQVDEKVTPKKEESPLPKLSAFEQLVAISRSVPARDKVKLQVDEMEIKKDKVSIRATSESQASIDEIEKALKQIPCFSEVQRGKVTSGNAEEKQFTLTITSKCL